MMHHETHKFHLKKRKPFFVLIFHNKMEGLSQGGVVIDLRKFMKDSSTESRQPLEALNVVDFFKDPEWIMEAHSMSGTLVNVHLNELHPLVATANIGFSDHYNISFSPDDFLLPLLNQLAFLMNRGEKKKDTVKRQLTVTRTDFALGNPKNPWNEIFSSFREQIRSFVSEEDFSLFQPQFSTTSVIHQSGYDVCLMDAFQSCFSYHNMFMCGIPSVTLRGTPHDWTLFQQHAFRIVDRLKKYCPAEGWEELIRGNIEKIARCGSGTPWEGAEKFWCDFYRYKMHSGGAGVDGWICSFFPVFSDSHTKKSKVCKTVDEMYGKNSFGGTRNLSSFPASFSTAPVTCNNMGQDHVLRYVAGQLGVQQDKDGVVQPAWGWYVQQKK